MRGWVYIITNKAMPDLLKVGFTLKDPDLRAVELGHTGSPHPYVVEYEMMVRNPKDIEQRIHSTLQHVREGKEWFRCSLADAIKAIRIIVGADSILENIRGILEPAQPSAEPDIPEHISASDANTAAKFKRTATYAGACAHCGSQFTVTLTRYDSGARCPDCFRMNDTTEFELKEFLI